MDQFRHCRRHKKQRKKTSDLLEVDSMEMRKQNDRLAEKRFDFKQD